MEKTFQKTRIIPKFLKFFGDLLSDFETRKLTHLKPRFKWVTTFRLLLPCYGLIHIRLIRYVLPAKE